ncbi:septum formation family protein [Kitasatospora sp. McL0602]|uniref:septum formation family protein n=1 Tax=Kitasatospora sp. McL0602 TaxID=3439530 RepID=UPI003F8CE2A9
MRGGVLAGIGVMLGGTVLTGTVFFGAGGSGDPGGSARPADRAAAPSTVRVGDLGLGACFTGTEPGYGAVRRVDCGQRHDGEVFGRARFSTADFPSNDLPAESELEGTAETECSAEFSRYAIDGRAVPLSVRVSYAYPDLLGWHRPAGREAVCVLTDSDGPRTGTLRQDPSRLTGQQRAYLDAENHVNGLLRELDLSGDTDEDAGATDPVWNAMLSSAVTAMPGFDVIRGF